MYVRDGQLRSQLFKIFVTTQLEPNMAPELSFVGGHLLTQKSNLEAGHFGKPIMASHQIRPVTIDGAEVQASGTVLMFELPPAKFDFKSAVRLLPILTWSERATPDGHRVERKLIANDEVYLGNIGTAAFWTAAMVATITALLLGWSTSKSKAIRTFNPKPWLLLITGPDGYLSLWRAQLMIWTFAVASLVFLFGLLQLKVPTIPESLVSLMGLSLATGVLGKMGQPSPSKAPPPPEPAQPTASATFQGAGGSLVPTQAGAVSPNWFDLISTWNFDLQQVELSIPKAQMVVWTLVVVVLFCVKSVLGGELWVVPWELVALTGFSQAGYLGDKVVVQRQQQQK